MARTLLQIVQDSCYTIGMPAPGVVASSSSDMPKRMLRLINSEGRTLVEEHDWQKLRVVGDFTTALSGTPQSSIPVAAQQHFSPETSFWDVANRRPLIGPVSIDEWIQIGLDLTSSVDRYWIMLDGVLNIQPVSGSADTIRYSYQSKNWVVGADTVEQSSFDADDDQPLISDRLLELGLVWRWKHAIGTDYAEDMAIYSRAKENIYAADRVRGNIVTSSPFRGDTPPGWWPGTVTG